MEALNDLTGQERRVLALVAQGQRNAQIAQELVISIRTVQNHLYHIFDKLGVTSRTEAARFAWQAGLPITPDMPHSPDNPKRTTAVARMSR